MGTLDVQLFPRKLHAKLYTYLGEIQLFQRQTCGKDCKLCNILTGPLINMIFKGQRAMLKERAFQQCMYRYIGVSFRGTLPYWWWIKTQFGVFFVISGSGSSITKMKKYIQRSFKCRSLSRYILRKISVCRFRTQHDEKAVKGDDVRDSFFAKEIQN